VRKRDQQHPQRRARVAAEQPTPDVGGIDEQQYREDQLGEMLGNLGVQDVRQRMVGAVLDRHHGEHEHDRRGDPPRHDGPCEQSPDCQHQGKRYQGLHHRRDHSSAGLSASGIGRNS